MSDSESLRPGDRFQDCDGCPQMVVLPPGSFWMGSSAGPEGQLVSKDPGHKVTINYQFAVGVHAVTFNEWDYCVKHGGCRGYYPNDQGCGRGNRPVIGVSWEDAKAYACWLSQATGKEYRLLSETEWEYAACLGTTTPFCSGNTISTNQANYRRTTPGGPFPANGFGLHDMHGNVKEWVKDCWHNDRTGAPTDGSAWITGDNCSQRVLRVGDWIENACWFSFPGRTGKNSDFRHILGGFRVALTLTL